jgi:hypothetical protein
MKKKKKGKMGDTLVLPVQNVILVVQAKGL